MFLAQTAYVHSKIGDWPVGTWHIVRHLSHHKTLRLSWKIVPFHRHKGRSDLVYWGTEGYAPDTVFAWIHCSLNGKSVRIPRDAYSDCGNCREFKTIFEEGKFIYSTWSVREIKDKIEIVTEFGAHGGRAWIKWYLRNGKYAGRDDDLQKKPDLPSFPIVG